MTNLVFGKKLGRNYHQRQALLKSLAKSMFTYGSIETTQTKAKAVIPTVEKLCAIALKNDLSAHRFFHGYFQNKKLVTKSIIAVNKAFADQKSNFTRTTRIKKRQGDDALIVKLAFTKPYSLELNNKEDKKEEVKKTKKPVKAEQKRKITTKKEQK